MGTAGDIFFFFFFFFFLRCKFVVVVGCCCCFSSAYSGLAYNVVFVSGVQSRGFSDPSTSIYPSVLSFSASFPL